MLRLDPAQIKYLVISPAHGDRYGGTGCLIEKYRPRVVMSEMGWRELEKPVLQSITRSGAERDMTVADGDTLQLSDTTVVLFLTPGHTPGTLTTVFTARDGSQAHRAMLWGDAAFNFDENAPQLRSYVASTDRMMRVVAQEAIDVILSSHARYDGSLERLPMLATRQPGDPHPYVVGVETVTRAVKVVGECARAFLASFDSQ